MHSPLQKASAIPALLWSTKPRLTYSPFSIKVTLVEPAAYATDFGKSKKIADVLEPYGDFRKQAMARLSTIERSDPQATSEAIFSSSWM